MSIPATVVPSDFILSSFKYSKLLIMDELFVNFSGVFSSLNLQGYYILFALTENDKVVPSNAFLIESQSYPSQTDQVIKNVQNTALQDTSVFSPLVFQNDANSIANFGLDFSGPEKIYELCTLFF